MKPMNDRTQLGKPRPTGSPAQRQRFRIQKLEERIAPAKGGNGTKNCGFSIDPSHGPGPCNGS